MEAWNALLRRRPGEPVDLAIVHRGGVRRETRLVLDADPSLQILDLGGSMTPEQRAFRAAWLGSRQ